ncbi:putative 2OG-Fe(II) oxygenase [Novosphingobium sediminicola]|uniref:Tetratricopeptide (TPR) repeat protein n=1 Tax=Novosphingobium sediminicola TaxID=563162 RepID=A0A7W6CHK3_9SPHN|nr:tetratricopeptide (TPR) repeat protein [Novosphingobium sediminicola]
MNSEAIQWRDTARALRAQQRMIEADEAIAKAHALAPEDRLVAFLHAQSRYELGHRAADLFAQVCRLWPDNPDALRNHAMALASEGDIGAAVDLLTAALAQNPQWLDGHRVLASLRWVAGDAQDFDASYATAARANPRAQGLWLGWFSAVAQHRDWPRARAILEEAERHLGQTKPLTEARLFIANESGDGGETARLLASTEAWDDPFIQVARIRAALRAGDPARALSIALPLAQAAPGSPLAGQAWPYVSTCWRLLDDPRRDWLDGDFVRSMDVGLGEGELDELGECLRALHIAQLPYPEQSVRGGTQTDRSVLLRHEPILQRARVALMAAVKDYVATLPAPDPAHPLLSRPRDHLRISGSWSVRLTGGGYNIPHSHPMGWISSAFYVSLPQDTAPAPAGHFHYGAPPPELGLDLTPYATIAPQRGHLVLFPSTLWHGTVPTASGERLNIAFDVVPAQA